jgi:hypothetical protein
MFELEKAVQSINYIIHSLGVTHLGKLDVLKMIFLADRYHLRTYGRPITNDEYWAMTYGPVASSVKDVVDVGDYLSTYEKSYTTKFLGKAYSHQVKSVNSPDLDVLSQTDLEALDKAVELKKQDMDLVQFTHLFPEWKKHEANIENLQGRVKMDLVDCFEQAPSEAEYSNVDDELLELNKEHYLETLELHSSW